MRNVRAHGGSRREFQRRSDAVPSITAIGSSGSKSIANWGYLDATLERTWDEIFSTTKARRFGFHDWEDSEERLLALIGEYRAPKILP